MLLFGWRIMQGATDYDGHAPAGVLLCRRSHNYTRRHDQNIHHARYVNVYGASPVNHMRGIGLRGIVVSTELCSSHRSVLQTVLYPITAALRVSCMD